MLVVLWPLLGGDFAAFKVRSGSDPGSPERQLYNRPTWTAALRL